MKVLFLTLASVIIGATAFGQKTDQLLDHYINVKNALVLGDNKTATQAIASLHQSVKGETDFVQKSELLKATEKLHNANSLEKQRAAFNDVSTTMWKLVKDSEKITHAVYYQYCPMKKAYWLSNENEIRNPYYGSAMLTCGKVSETKK